MSTQMMIQQRIRIRKQDAAFVYAILESLEGMVAFSTLTDDPTSHTPDVQLWIPEGFSPDVATVLEGLSQKFPLERLAAR